MSIREMPYYDINWARVITAFFLLPILAALPALGLGIFFLPVIVIVAIVVGPASFFALKQTKKLKFSYVVAAGNLGAIIVMILLIDAFGPEDTEINLVAWLFAAPYFCVPATFGTICAWLIAFGNRWEAKRNNPL